MRSVFLSLARPIWWQVRSLLDLYLLSPQKTASTQARKKLNQSNLVQLHLTVCSPSLPYHTKVTLRLGEHLFSVNVFGCIIWAGINLTYSTKVCIVSVLAKDGICFGVACGVVCLCVIVGANEYTRICICWFSLL